MAQLKDTLITGSLTATNMIRAQTTLMSPNFTTYSSSTKQNYGVGTDGQVLRSDGTDTYWSDLTFSNISGTLGISQGGTNATTIPAARANLGASPYVQGVFYGTCSTEQATQAKQVTLVNGEGFTLATGVMVSVKFTYAAAAATMTMAIRKDSSSSYCDAKNLCRYHTTAMSSGTTTSGWRAGAVVTFVYDGTQWERIFWENSTYYYTSIYCDTAADTAKKVGAVSGAQELTAGKYFQICMIYNNTAQSALSLNISSKGEKPIYINGTISSSSNYTLPRGCYIVYYDGTNYYFRTDGKLTANITGTAGRATADADGNTISSTYLKLSTVTTAGDLLYATGNGAISRLAAGTSGYLLQSNGAAAPSWIQASDSSIAYTIAKRNGYGEICGTSIIADGGALAVTASANAWLSINFNSMAGSNTIEGVTYETFRENGDYVANSSIIFQAPIKITINGSSTLWSSNLRFRIYSYNNNGYRTDNYIDYILPDITANLPATTIKQIWTEGASVTGAVWNDYAEYRNVDCEEPGRVVFENGDDTLSITTERLSHFAGVISDTWGFAQGKTENAKVPIAVAGRVLVYPYKNRDEYKPGDVVCAAPNGTVDIMTREEIKLYPDRIVGTVSCVPDYEEWGGGPKADRDPIKVNNRVWIKVK